MRKRRYSVKDIIKRREEYVRFLMSGKPMLDMQKAVLLEYERSQKARGGINRTDLGRFRLMLKRDKSNLYIPRIVLSVTNQCSLKCRDCMDLMPYCKERYTIEVEEQIEDLKKVLSYVDGIINVEVIGGEPFVYKDLARLLEYLCDEPKIKFVEVTTNGTVIPSAEVMKLLKRDNICVYISDYGKVNGEKAERLYKILSENNVYTSYMKCRDWILAGGVENRKKSRHRLQYEYYHCFARKICRTMYRGKLYVCGRAPILDELGLLSDKSSYLDIRNMNGTKKQGREKIHQFYNNKYAECCNYCDCHADGSLWIEAGVQLK